MARPPARLATRVAVAASALALFFVLMMGGGAWLVASRAIRAQVDELLATEATLRAERISDLIEGIAANFRALAGNDAIARILADSADSAGRDAYLRPLLAELAVVNGLHATLTVTDFVGRPLVGSVALDRHDADPWVAGIIADGRARAKVAAGLAGVELVVAEPVRHSGRSEVEGALVWRVGLDELARRAARQSGAAAGELRIEADGRVRAVPLGRGLDAGDHPVTADVRISLSPLLSVLHMNLLIGGDRQILADLTTRLATTFLAIGAASTLLVVLFSVLLGRRLTAALSRLADVAGAFAFGKSDPAAFSFRGDDEIARLGAAFAGMVERLDEAYHDLERRSLTLLSNAERVAQMGSASWEAATGQHVWSDHFHALIGLVPGEEAPGREAFLRRVHPGDRRRLSAALDAALAGEGDGRLVEDIRVRRSDGSIRVGQLRAEVTRGEDGHAVRMDMTIQDISERKALEQKLDALVLELRRSNTELEQFAYVASHDLRQPLRTVRSYMTLIEEAIDDKLDGDTREFMGFIRDGVRRMDALITDLLAYSRVGRTSTDAPVDTGRAVDLAVMDLQGEIDEAGAQVSMPQRMPVVLGDTGEMARLFQNLIGNAVKYRSPERPALVTVAYHDRGERWEFTVADNGIGIPDEHAERVFGIFQRLHARDEYEGTGIGLAICRKVVERLGGHIWFSPAPDGGTVFHFTLPKLKRGQDGGAAG